MEQNRIKEIPYGVSDFDIVRRDNLYYVDKTMYLPKLEGQARYLFFIRPRRFGKSVFISMLHAYYDIRNKDKFQDLFGDLWIGQHPTPLQGKFQVLYLDFSQVGGDIERLEERFNFFLGIELDGFVRNYQEYYPEETIRNKQGYTENSIFLPAPGYRYKDNTYSKGSNGNYFSSSIQSDDYGHAFILDFTGGYRKCWGSNRYLGCSVRPVAEK